MKKARRALAASFVVTVAASPSIGCKKTSNDNDGSSGGNETAYVHRDDYTGTCRYSTPEHCPKGASCNPPPPREVDCPPNMRDAGDPPAITRRPPGKEDWLRMRGVIWPADQGCTMNAETFCAPPGKPIACTPQPEPLKIACTKSAVDAGQYINTFQVASFTWKDVEGKCHKTAAFECTSNKRCEIPEGEIVACQ